MILRAGAPTRSVATGTTDLSFFGPQISPSRAAMAILVSAHRSECHSRDAKRKIDSDLSFERQRL